MRTLLFAVALTSAACTLDMSEPKVNAASQDATTWNRLAANRLAANRLAANRLAANRLAANSLSSTKLVALNETADILRTLEGRTVYSYIIGCALESPMSIQKDGVHDYTCTTDSAGVETCVDNGLANDDYCVDGHCEFNGDVGLAPEWADRKLGPAGEGWISACLFARCNANDTAEKISLRGRDAALTTTPEEASIYGLQEGAFYGNVFTGDNKPIEWYACMGRDQYAGEQGGLALRDCTEPDPANPGKTMCGFTYAGTCDSYSATPGPYACSSTDAAGNFSICYEADRAGHWGGLQKYRQVITTYVSY